MIVVYVSWNTSCNFFFFFSFLYSFIPIGCHLLFYHLIYYFTVILYLYYSSTVHVRGFNLPKFYWKSLFLFYFFLFVGIHVRRSFSFCRNIRISLNIGVLMLNSLFLTENLFMLPSFLEGIFIWYTIINCSYFFFRTLEISLHCLLTFFFVLIEKSAPNLIFHLLKVICCFPYLFLCFIFLFFF